MGVAVRREAWGRSAQVLGRLRSPVLVGREWELESIVEGVLAAPALALLEGEAGVGKTRLVQELLARPELAPCHTHIGRCYSLSEPFPLGPIVEALRDAALPTTLPAIVGALRPLLPELAARLPESPPALSDPAAEQHRTFRALRELLACLGPSLVVVLEDLHCADQVSLEFLRFLAPQLPDGLALVCTYRREDLPDGSPLLGLEARLPVEASSVHVALSPLGKDEMRELVGKILDTSDVSEQFASFLFERTAGLPFAVEEVLLLLKQRRDLVRRDGVWVRHELEGLGVPTQLRDAIFERKQRLSPAGERVVRAAAVLSSPADSRLLFQLAGLGENDGAEALEEALASALLFEVAEDRYGFRHALACQAIKEGIPRPALRRMHLDAARLLEARPDKPLAQLAHHYREAGQTTAWIRYAEAAADRAVTLNDQATAYRFLRDALSVPDLQSDTRARLGVKLARRALGCGAHSEAIEILEPLLADTSLPRQLRGEMRFLRGVLVRDTSGSAAGIRDVERSLDDLDGEAAARALAWLAAVPTNKPIAQRMQYLERAGHLASRLENRALTIAIAADRAAALAGFGDRRAWRAIEEIPSPRSGPLEPEEMWQTIRGYGNVADALLHAGHYDKAETLIRQALELAVLHAPGRTGSFEDTRFQLDWLLGRWEGLEEALTRFCDTVGEVPVSNQAEARTLLALLSLARGNTRAAETALRSLRKNYGGDLPMLTWLSAGLARLRLAAHDAERAVEEAALGVHAIEERGSWVWAAEIVPVAVAALLATHRRSEALELVQAFDDGLVNRDAPAASVALTVCRGQLAKANRHLQAAVDYYDKAEQEWRALGRPYEAAKLCAAAGHCLLLSGHDEGRARMLLALEQFLGLGAAWDADGTRRLLRARGVRIPHGRGRKSYGDQLSPRELQVARLSAEGLSNRELASALFLSLKTVEAHQTSIRKKLGIASRDELGERLSALPRPSKSLG